MTLEPNILFAPTRYPLFMLADGSMMLGNLKERMTVERTLEIIEDTMPGLFDDTLLARFLKFPKPTLTTHMNLESEQGSELMISVCHVSPHIRLKMWESAHAKPPLRMRVSNSAREGCDTTLGGVRAIERFQKEIMTMAVGESGVPQSAHHTMFGTHLEYPQCESIRDWIKGCIEPIIHTHNHETQAIDLGR